MNFPRVSLDDDDDDDYDDECEAKMNNNYITELDYDKHECDLKERNLSAKSKGVKCWI